MQSKVYHNGQTIKSDLGVLTTIDYARFKISKRNRAIDPNHLMALYDAIQAKNLLRENPIKVTPDMEVIDGQHRLKVAESLQVPIYYMITERMSLEDAASLNRHTKSWNAEDYLKFWIEQDKIEYLKLSRFLKRYTFLSVSRGAKLCYYGTQGTRSDTKGLATLFNLGHYVANDIPFAERVADASLDFKPYCRFWNQRTFMSAIQCLVANDQYDHARMMDKMEYLAGKLTKCVNTDAYLAIFTDIYNYKSRSGTFVMLRRLRPGDPHYRTDRRYSPKAK